jgi:putative FmdB family regulatory protein
MPVYTYRCDNCGVQFDHRQSFSDPVLEVCPECSEKAIHKVYTPVGIVFKGSGFYATDNRSPSGQSTKKSSHESTGSSESDNSSTKSDSTKTNTSDSSKNESSTSSNTKNSEK